MHILTPDAEFEKHVIAMSDKSILWRGTFLEKITFLERTFDWYLATYFCNTEEKAGELIHLIISNDRITYESKRQVLLVLINKHEPTFKAQFPKYAKELQEINEFRNILAHYMLDTTPDGVTKFVDTGNLRYMKFKNDISFLEYSDSQYHEILDLVKIYIEGFGLLITLINKGINFK